MLRLYLVDLIVVLGTAAIFISMPLMNLYVYERVTESHNYTKAGHTYCADNDTANQTKKDQIIANEVAQWNIRLSLLNSIPGIFSSMVLITCGDKLGRRAVMVFPLVGIILNTLIQELVIIYRWPLTVLYASAIVSGLSGTSSTLMTQGVAYICDATENQHRGIRLTKFNAVIGLGGGLAGIASGYWINQSGFTQPGLLGIGVSTFGLLLIFFLPSVSKIRKQRNLKCAQKRCESDIPHSDYGSFDDRNEPGKVECRPSTGQSSHNEEEYQNLVDHTRDKRRFTLVDLLKSMWRVYTSEYTSCEQCFSVQPDLVNGKCIHDRRIIHGRLWRLWMYTLILFCFSFIVIGSQTFQTIFLLSYPLCFTPALIGFQQALCFLATSISPFFAFLLERCLKLSGNFIIFIGLLGLLFQQTMMCFSSERYVVFIATSGMTLAWVVKPFILNQLSSLSSKSEQGAVLALSSTAELSSLVISNVSLLPLYPATLYISHWFIWIFTSSLCSIPLFLIGVILVADYRRQMHSDSDVLQPLINS